MIEIPLTQGQVALIDDDKYDLVSQYKWFATYLPNGRCFYALTSIYVNGMKKQLYLHRFLLGLEFGNKLQADHINKNTLDNRLENLRIATSAENCRNRRKRRDNTSGYIGVSWHKRECKWRTQIKTDGIMKHIGYFRNKHDAARAYNEAALKYHGEFAELNEITEES